MRRHALLHIFVVLAFAATTAIVFAQASAPPGPPAGAGPRGQGPGRMFGPGALPPGLIARLQLTDQQRADIRSLVTEQRAARHSANIKQRDLRQQLDAQVFADTPDTAKIKDLQSQIAAAQADGLAARVDLQVKIAQILTPDQRAQALTFLSQRQRGRMGPRR